MVPSDGALVGFYITHYLQRLGRNLQREYIWGHCRKFTLYRKLGKYVQNYVHICWPSGASSTVGFP